MEEGRILFFLLRHLLSEAQSSAILICQAEECTAAQKTMEKQNEPYTSLSENKRECGSKRSLFFQKIHRETKWLSQIQLVTF